MALSSRPIASQAGSAATSSFGTSPCGGVSRLVMSGRRRQRRAGRVEQQFACRTRACEHEEASVLGWCAGHYERVIAHAAIGLRGVRGENLEGVVHVEIARDTSPPVARAAERDR